MLRRKFNGHLTAAASCLTAGCAHWKDNENLVRLAIAGSTGLQYLPHILASELGFYRQNGIEVAPGKPGRRLEGDACASGWQRSCSGRLLRSSGAHHRAGAERFGPSPF